MNPIVRMAVRNVRKNWRHSLAAMLSIAAGFVALTLFDGYMADMASQYEEGFSERSMFGNLIIEREGAATLGREDPWAYAMDESDQAFVDEFLASESSHVRARVRFLNMSGLAANGASSSVFVGYGFDAKEGAMMRGEKWVHDTFAGIPLQEAGDNGALLGMGMGESIDCEAGPSSLLSKGTPDVVCKRPRLQLSATTEKGQLNAVEPNVSGLINGGFKEFDARYVAVPLPLAQQLLGTRKISMVTVGLTHPGEAEAFAARIKAAAKARHIALDATPWQRHPLADLLVRSMTMLAVFRNFVSSVVMAVAGLSVLNAIVKAVSERTREIGTLRSIGFLRKHVLFLFTLEAALLAMVSTAIGLVASLILTFTLNHAGILYKAGMLSESVPLKIAIVPGSWLFAGVLLSGIATVAAFLPAYGASRMRITDALGHV